MESLPLLHLDVNSRDWIYTGSGFICWAILLAQHWTFLYYSLNSAEPFVV